MSDFKRILDDSSSDAFDRGLLANAGQARMPADGRARVAASLGIAVVAGAGTAKTTSAVSPSSSSAKPGSHGTALSFGAKIGLAVLGAIAIGGVSAALVVAKRESNNNAVSSPALVASTDSPSAMKSVGLEDAQALPVTVEAPISVDSLPSANVAASAPSQATSRVVPAIEEHEASKEVAASSENTPTATSASPDKSRAGEDILEEVRALDAVRAALRQKEPGKALELLSVEQKKRPSSAFTVEREALRIEALMQNGNTEEARALAADFLRSHGQSTAADRVKRAIK